VTASYDIAAALLECARAQLEQTSAGVPDRVCVVPGAELAWDDCECGQLTVHITQQYSSKIFPAQDSSPMQRCGTGYIVVVYVVTILRCIPVGDEQGPPSCTELDAAAQDQAEDARAVWDAVICCFSEDADYEFTVLNQAFVGPSGFCGGSALTIAVGLSDTEPAIHEVVASDFGAGSGG
jgi:hypothetical protein